jgi:hypothetical protein
LLVIARHRRRIFLLLLQILFFLYHHCCFLCLRNLLLYPLRYFHRHLFLLALFPFLFRLLATVFYSLPCFLLRLPVATA